jgi:hypothetical protein
MIFSCEFINETKYQQNSLQIQQRGALNANELTRKIFSSKKPS